MDRTDKNTQNRFFNSEKINPESDRQTVSSIPMLTKIVIYLTVVLSSSYIPIFLFFKNTANVMSIALTVICAVFMLLTVRRIDILIPAILISVMLISISGSLAVTALFLGFVVSAGAASFTISADKNKNLFLFILLPVLSYMLSFAMTRDLPISAVSLTLYPVIFLHGFMLRKSREKLHVIYSVLILLIATFIISAAVYMTATNTGIADVTNLISDYRQQLASVLAEYHVTDMLGNSVYLFENLTNARAFVDSIFNILPALIFIALFFVILLTYNFSIALTQSMGYAQRLRSNMLIFKPGVSSAAVFLVAFAISLTTDSAGNVLFPTVVAQNIYLILSPGLMITGASYIMSLIRRSRRGFWLLFLIPIVLFSLYIILIIAFVFVGAAYLIIDHASKWASSNVRK